MFVKRRHLMSFTHTLHPSRKNIRLSPMVYQLSGLTFLTVCTLDREPLFGCIEQGALHPTEIGNQVAAHLDWFANRYTGMEILQWVVMPNHIHLLVLRNQDRATISLAGFINQFKGCTTRVCGRKIWQRGYYDHLVRTPGDGVRIMEYIGNNPRKWELDQYFGE